jgi:hypothetical protein
MSLMLTEREKKLLIEWLPHGSSLPKHYRGVRGLLAEHFFDPMQPHEVEALLSDLKRYLATLRDKPSTLIAPGMRLSPWQRAWLIVDQHRSAGSLSSVITADKLCMSRLNALCVAVLCLEDPGEARAFVCAAAAIPDDDWVEYALSKHTGKNLRAWVRWLAGQEPLPSRFEESLSPGVDAALQGRWADAFAEMPAKLQKSFPKPIPRGPLDLMMGKLLCQVTSHAQRRDPKVAVIEESLGTLFCFWGRKTADPWWDGSNVSDRLPLLALVAQFTSRDPLELLHDQRRHNPHLMSPPPRTFTPPEDVMAVLGKLEQILEQAQKAGCVIERVTDGAGAVGLRSA